MSVHGSLSLGLINKNVRGYEIVDISGGGLTLTAAQAKNAVLIFDGAAAPTTVNMAVGSDHPAIMSVFNYGGAAVTFEFASNPGQGITIPAGCGSMVLVVDANEAMLDLLNGYART